MDGDLYAVNLILRGRYGASGAQSIALRKSVHGDLTGCPRGSPLRVVFANLRPDGRLRARYLDVRLQRGGPPRGPMREQRLVPARSTKLVKIAPRRSRPPLTLSEIMGRIRSKDTKPEVKTRSAGHALGRRFRIHVADLLVESPISPTRRDAGLFSFTAASGTHTRAASSLGSPDRTPSMVGQTRSKPSARCKL